MHLIIISKKPGQKDKLTGTPEPYLQTVTVPVKPRRMISLNLRAFKIGKMYYIFQTY